MGRFLTDTKLSSTTGIPTAYTTLVAGENIQQGDLLSLHDDGKVYWVTDPEDKYAQLRPLSAPTASTDVILGEIDLAWGAYKNSKNTSNGIIRGATLTNGNVVVACTVVGPNNLQFRIVNILGEAITSKVTVGTVNNVSNNFVLTPLNGGGFSLVYQSSSSAISKAVYDNSGNVVLAPTVIESVAPQGGMGTVNLSDGSFVVVYYKTIGGLKQPVFARHNAAGVLQGAITQIHSATGNGTVGSRWNTSMDVCSLNNGYFVVGFAGYSTASSGNQVVYAARFNSSGVLQGSVITVSTVPGNSGDPVLVKICQTSDNGFAIAARAKSSGANNVISAKYDSSGNLVGTVFVGTTKTHNGDDGAHHICQTGDGGFFAVFAGDLDATYGRIHFHRGYSTGTVFEIDGGANGGTSPVHASWNPYFNTYFWHHAYRNSTTTIPDELHIRRNTAIDIDDVSTFTLEDPIRKHLGYANNKRWNFSHLTPCPGAISSPYAVYANVHTMNTGVTGDLYDHVKFSAYRLSTATFIGVATTAATAGNPVTIQVLGVVNTRLSFTHSFAADYTNTSPPGQKFHLVGNTCILHGIQETLAT